MEDQKTKALTMALQQIEKAHGKGSIMKLGEKMFPLTILTNGEDLRSLVNG